jgi:hypothetical protein
MMGKRWPGGNHSRRLSRCARTGIVSVTGDHLRVAIGNFWAKYRRSPPIARRAARSVTRSAVRFPIGIYPGKAGLPN